MVYPFGEDAVVTGVRPGERVVVDGRQNLRPGATVVERAPTDGGGGRGAARPLRRRRRRRRPASEAAPASGPAAAAAPSAMSSGATP